MMSIVSPSDLNRSRNSSTTSTTLTHTDGNMDHLEGGKKGRDEHQHHAVEMKPPVRVPPVGAGEDILPAEADQRDREREEEDLPSTPASQNDAEAVKPTGDIYDKFSPARKRAILAIVSYSAFISPVTSSIFLPSIPEMSVDLNTSAKVLNYTIAIFLVTIGTAPLIWSPLSGFYGRKPVYLISMPLHIAASIGVARSQNVGQIIGTRILQGIGGSSVLAVGAGSVGDIFRPTERANAMGWFYVGALMGPSLAPLIGGIFTESTAQSWRSAQYLLAGCGALSFLLVLFFLPETSHPPLPHRTLREERGKKFVFYYFNPLGSLGLFRWWNIVFAAFTSSCVMLETYCFVVPLASVFKDKYGVHNVAVAGALYIANGGGNIIGGRLAGPYCDYVVRRYIDKRGFRRPEDRLRAAVLASGVLMPLSCLAYGWLIQTGAGGIAPPIVMMVLSGIALMFILTPLNTYLVDCMQTRSAELIAVNNFMRYIFAAGASALILPIADSIGWGLTMTIAAIISWLATAAILAVLRWGHIWRERANKKYGYTPPAESGPARKQSSDSNADEKNTRTNASQDRDIATEGDHDHDHEHEHKDEPGSLIPAPALRNPGRRNTLTGPSSVAGEGAGAGGGLSGGGRLSRQSSVRSDMPPVEEVLKRTVSLSGASVHGG